MKNAYIETKNGHIRPLNPDDLMKKLMQNANTAHLDWEDKNKTREKWNKFADKVREG